MQDDTCHLPPPYPTSYSGTHHHLNAPLCCGGNTNANQTENLISCPQYYQAHTHSYSIRSSQSSKAHALLFQCKYVIIPQGCRSHSKWRAKFATSSGIKLRNEEFQELCCSPHTAGTTTIHLGKCVQHTQECQNQNIFTGNPQERNLLA